MHLSKINILAVRTAAAWAKAGSCLALLLLLASGLTAQVDIAAKVIGTVVDQSGAAFPGIIVLAKNDATGLALTATTNEVGAYIFPSVPAGTYTIECEAPGFKKFVAPSITLLAQKTVTLLIALQLGSATERIEVSAAAAMVDTATPTVQNTMDQRLLMAIPVLGRDPRTTAERLLPGSAASGNESGVELTSFNGVSARTNNYRIDGTDTNDYFHGSATPFPAVENLSEFTVTSSLPDASVGRGAGGQITGIIKSGTNSLHGQVWGYFQNSGMNANRWENNWKGVRRERGSRQWYGGNIGGPVVLPKIYNGKDRTFFFTSWEQTETTDSATWSSRVLSNSERIGNFTDSPNGIPVVDGVPTPILPVSRFQPMAKAILANEKVFPLANGPNLLYTWQPNSVTTTQTFLTRMDHNFSDKHRVFGSLWWYRDQPVHDSMMFIFGKASWAGHFPSEYKMLFPKKLQSWTLNDTYMLTPTMLNNFILGVKRLNNSVITDGQFGLTNQQLGIGLVPDTGAKPTPQQISIGGRTSGSAMWGGYDDQQSEQSVYIADNFTLIRGRHTWKVGVEKRMHQQSKLQTWGAFGSVGYADRREAQGGSGNGAADFLLGKATSFSQDSSQWLELSYPALEAYVQDQIRMSNKLTVTVGVRWMPHLGARESRGFLSTFIPGAQSKSFPTAPLGLVVAGDPGIAENLYGNRWSNLGPRAAFAYDILGNGKYAIRGGYGIFNDFQFLKGFNGYGTAAPFGYQYRPATETFDLSNPYAQAGGTPFPFKRPTPGDPANSSIRFRLPLSQLGFSQDYNAASIQQWNLTFEMEPIRSYLISVGYVATRGTGLDNERDLNWARFVPGNSFNTTASQRARRPYFANGFEGITMRAADNSSMYNSMQVRLNKRYAHGLTFLGHYTASSNTTQHGQRLNDNRAIDYFSPGLEQRFALTYSWDIPIPAGRNRVSKAMLGGWTLGGTVNGKSGDWLSVDSGGCDDFNMRSAGCVGNFLGGDQYATAKGNSAAAGLGVLWLDSTKLLRANETGLASNGLPIVAGDIGQRLFLGNGIQGVLKGPAGFGADAMLRKAFTLMEGRSLDFRLEAFNVLNHRVLGNPNTNAGNKDRTQIGIISSAWDPRRLQLSARIVF